MKKTDINWLVFSDKEIANDTLKDISMNQNYKGNTKEWDILRINNEGNYCILCPSNDILKKIKNKGCKATKYKIEWFSQKEGLSNIDEELK
jgi:hypothetical protein